MSQLKKKKLIELLCMFFFNVVGLNYNYKIMKNFWAFHLAYVNFVFMSSSGFWHDLMKDIEGVDNVWSSIVDDFTKKSEMDDIKPRLVVTMTKSFMEFENPGSEIQSSLYYSEGAFKEKYFQYGVGVGSVSMNQQDSEHDIVKNLLSKGSEDEMFLNEYQKLSDFDLGYHLHDDLEATFLKSKYSLTSSVLKFKKSTTSQMFESKLPSELKHTELNANMWSLIDTEFSYKLFYGSMHWAHVVSWVSWFSFVVSILTKENSFIPMMSMMDIFRFLISESDFYSSVKSMVSKAFFLKSEVFYKYWMNQLNLLVMNWYNKAVGFFLVIFADNILEIFLIKGCLKFLVEKSESVFQKYKNLYLNFSNILKNISKKRLFIVDSEDFKKDFEMMVPKCLKASWFFMEDVNIKMMYKLFKDVNIKKTYIISGFEFPLVVTVFEKSKQNMGYMYQKNFIYMVLYVMNYLNVFKEIKYSYGMYMSMEEIMIRLLWTLNGLYMIYLMHLLKLLYMLVKIWMNYKKKGVMYMHLELYYVFYNFLCVDNVVFEGLKKKSVKELLFSVFEMFEKLIWVKKSMLLKGVLFFMMLKNSFNNIMKNLTQWKIFYTLKKEEGISFYSWMYSRMVMADVVTQQGEVGSYTFEMLWVMSTTVSMAFVVFTTWGALYTLDSVFDPVVYVKVMGNQWFWEYELVYGFNGIKENLEKSAYYMYSGGYIDGLWFVEEMDCWLVEKCGMSELFIYSWLFDFYEVKKFSFLSNPISSIELDLGNRRMNTVDTWLLLPVGVDIRLLVTGMDVIHSFSVPAFGVKVDAMPGRINALTFNVLEMGVYYGQCSELCGMNHSFMPILVQTLDFSLFKKIMF